jgi:hypothetical protein
MQVPLRVQENHTGLRQVAPANQGRFSSDKGFGFFVNLGKDGTRFSVARA